MNWPEFFEMGGYASYVWGSFGVTALFMASETIMTLKHKSNTIALLRRKAKRMKDRRSS